MKRLPKYTPAEVRNDPYGFTYKEMSEVIERIKQEPYMRNCINSHFTKKIYQYQQKKSIKVAILKSMFMN